MSNFPVGIDAVAVYVPRLYVDLTAQWATTRAPELGEPSVEKLVGKVTQGVGVAKMAIADAHEDAATLAAMAAKRLIDQSKINPADIDYIAVGTETTVDQSKSMAAYVQGMLARHYNVDMSQCGAPQFQFACIGATYALEAAVSRIRAEENHKPYALVIATDISKYPLRTAGEYTQGAGAVAMLVCKNPRMLVLEKGVHATVTRDERDFFRPNWSQTAVVDGKYSIDVYLDLMRDAYAAYSKRLGAPSAYQAAEHFLFHVPFPRMAEYAAASLFIDELQGAPAEKRREAERAFMKTPAFAQAMAQKVEQSLNLSRQIGNVYSGSLYLALHSLAEHAADLAGQRVVMCSYGSGASARVLSGIFAPTYREGFKPIAAALSDRHALSLADYERLHHRKEVDADGKLQPMQDSVLAPTGAFRLARLGSDPHDYGYRYYEFQG